MSVFLGIDLGTSVVKALLVDERQAVRAAAEAPLATRHPGPLASEQDPGAWWDAVCATLDALAVSHRDLMSGVAAIGLAGQMHATVLLDGADRVLRPAMLWNDGRAEAEAAALNRTGLAPVLGVPAMAGLTAPKLLWLARHEPGVIARARSLLLPKDLIRLRLTGERATDLSDAAGTWLLDQAARRWSEPAAVACGIAPAILPPPLEGSAPAGRLRPEPARRFGLPPGITVAAGGGDTPCGGVGVGAVEDGQGYVSLGTSAQVFAAGTAYRPAPEAMVHAFCHAVPGRWYQMAALLNGASVLGGIARLLGDASIPALLAEAEAGFSGPSRLLVLPYLAGERTPHDDPHARGVVFGLSSDTTRAELVQAALEGVAFALADGRDALASAGTRLGAAGFIGGGARSAFWARIVAAALGTELHLYRDGARGPAFGAARLARLALGRDAAEAVLTVPEVVRVVRPDPALSDAYARRIEAFRALYRVLRPRFRAPG